MQHIPIANLKILEHIADFQYLTVPHLIRLGVSKHKESIYRSLRRFPSRGKVPIMRKDFGFYPGRGRIPSIFYLTELGAEIVAESRRCDIAKIRYPKNARIFERDYFHRMACVDFHISLHEWATKNNFEIVFFHTYYNKTPTKKNELKARYEAETQVTIPGKYTLADSIPLIPDIVLYVLNKDGTRHFRCVEIHRGQDIARFLRQMDHHVNAFNQGLFTDKYIADYGLGKMACRIQWIFEYDSTMNSAKTAFLKNKKWSAIKDYVMFDSLEKFKTKSLPTR